MEITIDKKDTYSHITNTSGVAGQYEIFPTFGNTPINDEIINIWDTGHNPINAKDCFVETTYIEMSNSHVGTAVYHYQLPGFLPGDIKHDVVWTDDVSSPEFNEDTYNIPLKWSWGAAIVRKIDGKTCIVTDLDANTTGSDRYVMISVGLDPCYGYLTIIQHSN